MSEGEPKFEEEKDVPVSKIVGGTPAEQEALLEKHREVFVGQSEKKFRNIALESLEKEKAEQDKKVIAFILEKMPEFIRNYGGVPVCVELEQVHLLDRKKIPKNRSKDIKETGSFNLLDEFVCVFDNSNKLQMAQTLTHELMHLNSFNSLNTETNPTLNPDRIIGEARRQGLSIDTADGPIVFDWLNEALVEELTKRFSQEYLKENALFENPKKRKTKDEPSPEFYPKATKDMNRLIDDLYERNKDTFQDKEEVFRLMVTGAMSGRILDLARLVESTYGKGSFRKISERKGIDEVIKE